MRIFTLVDFHHLVLALFLGAVAALLIYLGFRDRSRPIPAVLLFVYAGFAVWTILYVVFFGFLGGPI
jgi:hypothetical protein